jgi:hypothetical protein
MMGNVTFVTDVDKDVDIDKDVDLTVDKEVQAAVAISGNLATAEASADAIGGGDGGGSGTSPQFGSFLIDDFDLNQAIFDTGESITPGGASSDELLPNPEDTDIPDDANRELFVLTLSDGSRADIISNALGDMELNVDNDASAFANAFDQYTSSVGAFDPTPLVGNAQILANGDDGIPDDFIDVTIASFNQGTAADGDDATARVSIVVVDGDGDIALASAVLTDSFSSEILIPSPLENYLDETRADPPGSVIPGSGGAIVNLGFEDDADGDGNVPGGGGADDPEGGLDWDDIESITLIIEDRPGETPGLPGGIQTTDFFAFNEEVEETRSVSGTDLELDQIEIETFLPGEPGQGLLAETDVFAQVTSNGAFSFGEALAASSDFENGTDIG